MKTIIVILTFILSFSLVQAQEANKTYYIQNVTSNKVLDIPNGNQNDKVVVKQHTLKNQPNQQFKLVPKDGAFQIVVVSSNKCLDVYGASSSDKATVIQYQCKGTVNQLWFFEKREGNLFKIKAKVSGKFMDVYGASLANGASIIQYHDNGLGNQLWRLIEK